ncbi:serine hydrolase domain-containing protein [Nonomuraea typhae]|uniref:Serine hydrolase domain-containing protein n=1 Tax=Nonomuraea typhae TaxID=2603600 RepID=A0ABW7ZFB1_9ACTN
MSYENVQRVLDQAIEKHGVPGVVVEIRDGGETWFGTAGVADLTTGARRVPGEHMHMGSSGKAFTAATMLQLEAEGRLTIEDPVEKWLPGVLGGGNGYDGDKITIRHLLSNTGGLFVTGLAPEMARPYATRSMFDRNRFKVWTKEDLLRLAVSQPPIFEPGAAFAYSNGGFYLAGAIIEAVTGNSYADEVDRTVIKPLGLTHTHVRGIHESGYPEPHPAFYTAQFYKEGVDPADVTPENWQSMMEEPGLPPLDITAFNSSVGWSAGGVVSTLGDMGRFFAAISSGSLLPEEQHGKMWTTVSTEGGHWMPNARYGLGVHEFDNAPLRGVGGSLWGSYVHILGTHDGEHTLAVHTNTEWKSWDIAFDLVAAEFGRGR